jgi:hypothetical protein
MDVSRTKSCKMSRFAQVNCNTHRNSSELQSSTCRQRNNLYTYFIPRRDQNEMTQKPKLHAHVILAQQNVEHGHKPAFVKQ